MKEKTIEPAVYVGTYGKYNDGSIAGAWLKLSDFGSEKEFWNEAARIHSDEDDPEFMIQDTEYLPSSVSIERYYDELAGLDQEDVQKVLEYWDEYDSGTEAEHILDSFIDSVENIEHNGEALSFEENLGYYMVEYNNVEIPEHLEQYFNYEDYGREMEMNVLRTENYVFNEF